MPLEMKTEAKEHIASGVEKFTGADGCDTMTAAKFIKEQMDR